MDFESKRQTWWLHIDGKGRIVSTAATRGALRVLKPREKEGERVIEVAEVKATEHQSVALTVPDVERIVAWASLWRGCHDPHWSRDDDELFGRLQDIVHGLTEQESVDQGGEW